MLIFIEFIIKIFAPKEKIEHIGELYN